MMMIMTIMMMTVMIMTTVPRTALVPHNSLFFLAENLTIGRDGSDDDNGNNDYNNDDHAKTT